MRILATIAIFAFTANNAFADALSKKHGDILKNNESKMRLVSQKIQEKRVDLSPFNLNSMSAWRKELQVPTTKSDGIEILPYRVDQSPS